MAAGKDPKKPKLSDRDKEADRKFREAADKVPGHDVKELRRLHEEVYPRRDQK